MDDTCAVCAEVLQWVAYGPCGHRDICSTCVARLRFICEDRRCCICKTDSPSVFVTKALGDYTMTNDFSRLPSHPKEGRMGLYWYHEDTNAFFDDFDHYKMIKATCRLSCSVCDKAEDEPPPGGGSGPRRSTVFKSIEQLKGHMFHKHRLVMCSLCLESRKVFICEQKLYTKAQLKQHISSGDSEVDGDENERGGFAGHPVCEFCKTPFYGDNELYTHMSREHYTCHLCQRQHPGQYEYFRNYDDLEMHFRHEHFLCEDEACLAKKFVVFLSESEMKRHNTMEHGGKMSRSKRNAALQIPTSFRFRRGIEYDNRRGRGRGTHLSAAIEASIQEIPPPAPEVIDPGVRPVEPSNATTTEPKYLHALGNTSANGPLVESSFPPLPVNSSKKKSNASSTWGTRGRDNGASTSSWTVSDTESTSSGFPELQSFARRNNKKMGKMPHSSSAPNLAAPVESGLKAVEDVQSANRSLVEKLRHAIKFDEERFNSFKRISAQYRDGEISTSKYLDHVEEYGLLDLVLDLARLCPDSRKQNELVDAYLARNEARNKKTVEAGKKAEDRLAGKKAEDRLAGKKAEDRLAGKKAEDRLAEDVMSTVRNLQSHMKIEEDAEVLSKEGYRSSKSEDGGSSSGRGNGKKKASKFHRMRLGDGSIAALLDGTRLEENPRDRNGEEERGGMPVRGVWRRGGVQKLFM